MNYFIGSVTFFIHMWPLVKWLEITFFEYNNVREIRQMFNFMPDKPDYCWAPEDYLANPLWRQNFALLEKYQLSFDLMCFSYQMPRVAELAKKHPNIKIILEHCGMPINTPDALTDWKNGMTLLATQSNVSCRLGVLGTMVPDWNEEIAELVFGHLLSNFGSEGLLFATNFPTDSVFKSFLKQLKFGKIYYRV